ncbi:fructose-bisphosphate aldolase, class I [Neorickettsia risticii str. Illinois]|uniref:fructose-bisphosphate aldolase n=1 Tax=Neorickettsia risticii (strain Illinois) TaxID=434131 RepID=C6V422_NEORI|nr:class I fructose-bisphosphate aldolase [Neorickettsia risticii]ACT69140.1 fructose-bisphosphate aldolase, class I [Neorickettsia risticii str. Illinois]
MSLDKILSAYSHNSPGSRTNLARVLEHGHLGGTGRLLILPVDQGFEHGPDESFYNNPLAYDPEYHIKLAIDAGLSAYAAPLSMLQDVAHKYPNRVPLILKLNSASKLFPKSCSPNQAFISTPEDAIRLGCVGIGLTIYPGSESYCSMLTEAAKVVAQAKALGLVVVVWSYPRGGELSAKDETALDVVSYAAHMACLLGADIVKVKLPTSNLANKKSSLSSTEELSERVKVIVRSCFTGKRLVLFSGGQNKDLPALYEEVRAIKKGGGNGSIIGRNAFQRSHRESLAMLSEVISLYKQ